MKDNLKEMLEQVTREIENAQKNRKRKLEDISRSVQNGSEGSDVGSSIVQIAEQLVEAEVKLRMLSEQKTMFEYLLNADEHIAKSSVPR